MIFVAGLLAGCATSSRTVVPVREVGVAEARTLVASGQVVPVDIRSPYEFASGHLPGAVLVPFGSGNIDRKVRKATGDKPAMLYCRDGRSSGMALAELAGISGVLHFKAGVIAWKAAGGALEGSPGGAAAGMEIKEHETDVYRFGKEKGEPYKLSEVYHFWGKGSR